MKNPKDNIKLQAFIDGIGNGLSIPEAGRMAGFSTPYRDAVPYCMTPAVREMCRKNIRGRIDIEASPAAYRFLMSVLLDANAPRRDRIEVAKFLLSHSLPAPKAQEAPDDDNSQKTARDMSNDELRAILAETETALAERATLIEHHQPIDDFI